MQADALAQLRDIHLPTQPGWWPPAPGWWLVAGAVLLAIALGATYLAKQRRRHRPIRVSRKLLEALYEDYQKNLLNPMEFVHASNELLKRVLIHALHDRDAGPASGTTWLMLLDQYSRSDQFSNGPGHVLGNSRFQASASVDVPALYKVLDALLQNPQIQRGQHNPAVAP